MKVYIDDDFMCHATDDGTMTAVESDFFDGKCAAFIEGYRYIPAGASWNGTVFQCQVITPMQDYNILAAYQEQYESMLPEMRDMKTALTELEVIPDE